MNARLTVACNLGRLGRTLLAAEACVPVPAVLPSASRLMPESIATLPPRRVHNALESDPESVSDPHPRSFAHRWVVGVLVERVIAHQNGSDDA